MQTERAPASHRYTCKFFCEIFRKGIDKAPKWCYTTRKAHVYFFTISYNSAKPYGFLFCPCGAKQKAFDKPKGGCRGK